MSELLGELFSSRVRAAVLAHVLPRPHLGLSLTDLSRRLRLPISSLQHECYKLARLEILRDYRVGASRRYRPNDAWPLLPTLTALVGGALPLGDVLAGASEEIAGVQLIHLAVERGRAGPTSYLILVGDLTIEQIDGVFARTQASLAARIPPPSLELAFFRPEDWAARRTRGDDYWAGLVAPSTAPAGDRS